MPPPGALRFCPSRDETPERENDDDRDLRKVLEKSTRLLDLHTEQKSCYFNLLLSCWKKYISPEIWSSEHEYFWSCNVFCLLPVCSVIRIRRTRTVCFWASKKCLDLQLFVGIRLRIFNQQAVANSLPDFTSD